MEVEKLPRRKREKLRQRQERFVAGLELFSEKEHHNVSMNEIAEKAEFAVGTLHKFFKNKEALMLQKSAKSHDAAMKAIEGPDEEVEELRNNVSSKGQFFSDNRAMLRLYSDSIRSVILIALLGGVLLFGCDRQQSQAPTPSIPEVATVTLQTQQIVLTTELPGRTSAYRIAEIRPQVNGLILKRLFTEGSDVQAGQVLYRIDPAPFQATYDNAKAALGRAEANVPPIRLRVERYKELLPDKAVSQQEYDDAAAALKQAEAEIEIWKAATETARINLGYTRVTAPISGRIGKSNVTDGAIVTAYQPVPLATIQQLDPIYVDVPQSTTELLRLQRRMEDGRLMPDGTNQKKVTLHLEAGRAYPLEGTLQFRDITVDPTTGSVTLRLVFPNPKGLLLPGMFVRAVVKDGLSEQAILVPQQAVSRDTKGNPLAFTVDSGGKVQQRMLRLDQAIGDQWLVTSGLAPGDRVIVEGLQRVRPGASVKEVPCDAGKKSGGEPQTTNRLDAKSK